MDEDGVNLATYSIEDLQENYFEDTIKIMRYKHLVDEPMYSSKGVLDCPQSLQEMIFNWRKMMKQKISLVCFKEGCDKIVAVNILGVVTEKEFDAPHNYQGRPWVEVNNLKKFIKNNFFDPFSHYNVDKVMFAAGLYVDEKYRKRGIAVQMLKAREEIAKAVGIEVSSNVFSSHGAQRAAEKCKFDENFSIKYAELPKFTKDGDFHDIREETMKIMSKKFF